MRIGMREVMRPEESSGAAVMRRIRGRLEAP